MEYLKGEGLSVSGLYDLIDSLDCQLKVTPLAQLLIIELQVPYWVTITISIDSLA